MFGKAYLFRMLYSHENRKYVRVVTYWQLRVVIRMFEQLLTVRDRKPRIAESLCIDFLFFTQQMKKP